MIPTKVTATEFEQFVHNIMGEYHTAGQTQYEQGREWYHTAHQLAVMVGDGDVVKGAGIISALSAQTSWARNVKLAHDAAQGNVHGHFGQQLRKVEAIIDGHDPRTVLGGQKTINFFECIVDPGNPHAVVIDRHAHDLAVGRRFGSEARGLAVPSRYDILANAYRESARRVGVIPQIVQAVTWCSWINRKGN